MNKQMKTAKENPLHELNIREIFTYRFFILDNVSDMPGKQ